MIQEIINRIKIEFTYPIGTRLSLKNDYLGESHVVKGYSYYDGSGYLLFEDGGKLSIRRLDLITAVN